MGCDTDIAWAAGFLDGEGTFLLQRLAASQQKTDVVIRRPFMSASQSLSQKPLLKLKRILGGYLVTATRKTSTGRPVWIWGMVGGANIRRVMPLLIPHLTVKKRSGELLLRYADTLGVRGRRLTKEILSEREIIMKEMYSLPERKYMKRKEE